MSRLKILGAVLLVAGTLCLVYKGFSYTKKTDRAKFGPIEIQVKDKERVEIPVWVGVVLVAAGGGLLVFESKKSQV